MPRSPASRADVKLIDTLAGCGLSVSEAQLERWRTAGLLPRNIRHGLGQGNGSISALPDDTVRVAAWLALHSVRGRPIDRAAWERYRVTGQPCRCTICG